MQENIPPQIQDAVDQYMELHQVSKQLDERMKELKDLIVSFMKESEFEHIRDKNRTGKVQLVVIERASVTARYTTYNLEELTNLLEPALLQRCTVSVIDKDKLEALSKLGEVATDVLSHKSTKPSYSLNVRIDK